MLTRSLVVLMGILLPFPTSAEEPQRKDARQVTPEEVRASRLVGEIIFGVQAEERAEAERIGLAELEEEIRALGRAVEELERAAVGAQSTRRAELDQAVAGLAAERAAVEARLAPIRSPRQRQVALRALEKLAQLEEEAQQAADAPGPERRDRLAVLRTRIHVEREGFHAPRRSDEDRTPTVQLVPGDDPELPQ